MNLLFCIDRYHPSRGGAERYLQDLSAALRLGGHRVTVAALDAEECAQTERILIKAPGFPRLSRELAFARGIRMLKKSGRFDRVVGFRHVLDADLFQPHEGLFIDSLIGSIRPFGTNPLIKAFLFLKKLFSPKNLFFLYADRALFKRNRGLKVAALSEMTAKSIRRRQGRRAPAITVIPNGVDTERFNPGLRNKRDAGFMSAMGIPPRSSVVLFCAHNFRLKGLKEAIKGVAMFKGRGGDPVLVVAGRGKPRNYRSLCKRLGVEEIVIFTGDQPAMERLYAVADVLLHPTFYDPCSLVVLEALASGVPVITTGFNGAAELMTGERAGMVLDDPSDITGIASALENILDEERHSLFRAEAAKTGGRNAFPKHVERIVRWLQG